MFFHVKDVVQSLVSALENVHMAVWIQRELIPAYISSWPQLLVVTSNSRTATGTAAHYEDRRPTTEGPFPSESGLEEQMEAVKMLISNSSATHIGTSDRRCLWGIHVSTSKASITVILHCGYQRQYTPPLRSPTRCAMWSFWKKDRTGHSSCS